MTDAYGFSICRWLCPRVFPVRSSFAFTLAVVTALCAGRPAIHASEALSVTFQPNGRSVTAAGLTPGGACAVIVVWRTASGDAAAVRQIWRDAHANDAGTVTVTVAEPIPAGAFAAVADVRSGGVATTDESSTAFRAVAFDARELRRADEGDVSEISSPHASLLLLVVRRGEGAWIQVATDGGAGDADNRVDGRISTDPSVLQPIAHSGAPPRRIKNKDLLLRIDPESRFYSRMEVMP